MTKLTAFIDGSTYSQSVLDHAAWIAGATGLEIDVVHMIGRRDTSSMPVDLSGSLEFGAQQHLLDELARHDADRARLAQQRGRLVVDAGVARLKAAGIKGVHAMLRNGDIVEAVADLEPETELVVIGKRGEAADFAKLHLGSNLERVARVSTRPLLVASRAFQPIKRFLVAFDGGPSVSKAIDYIAGSQLFAGLEGHLVTAGKDAPEHRARLDAAARSLTAAGIAAHTHIEDGEPDKVIAAHAEADHIGLLVMGAYGHSRIRSYIIGSTTAEMVRSVQRPVMLFR